jgi:hypothetical protein
VKMPADIPSTIMATVVRIDHLKDFRPAVVIFFHAVKEIEDCTHVMKTALRNKDSMHVMKTALRNKGTMHVTKTVCT